MSAFMFVISDSSVKEFSTEHLERLLHYHNEIVDKYDWNNYKQCSFGGDRAMGSKASIIKIQAELKMRKSGTEGPLPHVSVPGYNPPHKKED